MENFGRFKDSRSARKDTSPVNYLVIYGSTVLQNSITSFTFLRLLVFSEVNNRKLYLLFPFSGLKMSSAL